MVQALVKTVTLEAFLQQPETKPASEYVDGQIIQKPMPKAAHSGIQGDLTSAINSVLKQKKIGRAFPELRCTFGDRSIVPDVTVLPWNAIPRDEEGKLAGDFFAAPPWMIEILSPDQSYTKVVTKILRSLESGTELAWLIDPAENCVFGYTPDWRTVPHEEADMQLPVPDFAEGFSLTVGELVTWLYE